MRAAVLTQINEPLKVWNNIELPALARGQVLVRLAYSGVCHSQLMEARGGRGQDAYLPHLLGHEGTGFVVGVGEGVQKVQINEPVVLTWIKSSGLEGPGVQYSHHGKTINAGGVTTFNELAIVSENRLVPLPKDVPMDVGVLFGCALLTGAGMVLNAIKPRENATLAVFGVGGVGLSAIIASRLTSLKALIAIDVEDDKLQLAKDFGASHIINSAKEDVVSELNKVTAGAGLDYAVEAAGLTSTIELAFRSVKKNGGLCVFASHPPSGEKIQLDPHDLICGKQIQGTWGGSCQPDRDIPLIAELYRKFHIPLEKMISKRYKLADINRALDDLASRRVARPLIEIAPQ